MGTVTLFLCGDVMTGRGIDQILPYPSNPILYEPYMRSAKGYVALAERVSGPLPRSAEFSYIWGDMLAELERIAPDARIINLETAVTTAPDYWQFKGINYRMHPGNIPCITAARVDCCVLANNHVMDWGYTGLRETLRVLNAAGIATAGAGNDEREAAAPAVITLPGKGRVLVFAYGATTSGIPFEWAATTQRPGVNLLPDLSPTTAQAVSGQIHAWRQPGDIVVVSVHWGANWGYEIPVAQTRFAHALVDSEAVDILYGHSSHHVKAFEVYQGKLILYGCGDFLNDYEGIEGYEAYRDDLSLMYLPSIDVGTGRLVSLRLVPTRIRNFRVNRASSNDTRWLESVLNREGRRFSTQVSIRPDGSLMLAGLAENSPATGCREDDKP